MISSLIGSALGFGSSFLPKVLDFFKDKQDHKHKIELLKVQSELELKSLDFKADIEETRGLYLHDRTLDGGRFINTLRASVRPVITYFFFLAFLATEIVIIIKVLETGGDWKTAVELMWTPETQGLFAAVMSFWFGSRAISKNKKG